MITAILFLTERELTQAKRNRFRNTEPEVESWQSIAFRSLIKVCLTLFLSLKQYECKNINDMMVHQSPFTAVYLILV